MKKTLSIRNIISYFQGTIRYKLYYSRFSFLIPTHIKEQISLRIKVMDKQCYKQGSCKLCGCRTTALQMANKTCEGNCYPKMMNKFEWQFFLNFTEYNEDIRSIIFKNLVNYPDYFKIKGYSTRERLAKRAILIEIYSKNCKK